MRPSRHTSPSSRRAWIEICERRDYRVPAPVALLAEGVDRNKVSFGGNIAVPTSPSSRRAWIEIELKFYDKPVKLVALLAEGVDRNLPYHSIGSHGQVALLAEGVDRNPLQS